MEVSSRYHGPAALFAGKEFLVLSEQQVGWAPEPVLTLWKWKKLISLPGIESQSIPWLSSPYPTQNLKGTYILIHINFVS